jgi:hypothetical protein
VFIRGCAFLLKLILHISTTFLDSLSLISVVNGRVINTLPIREQLFVKRGSGYKNIL